MKKLLMAACGLSFLLPAMAQTTTTVTGTIKDLTQSVVTSGQVTFELKPGLDSTISGNARFTPSTVTCTINGSGLIKANDGTSACVVTQNTALTPSGTYYKVCIQTYSVTPGSCFNWYALASTFDITTAVPTPATSPAYTFVDMVANQTIAGNKTFSGVTSFTGGNTTFSGTGVFEIDSTSASDYVNNIRFEQGLNPSVNSTLNQFGQTTELFTYAANSKTFTGQQNAVYGSFSHFGTGALTSGYGGVFESFNSGAATAALIVGLNATSNNGGVGAGVPAQTPTNNGNATNLRAVDATVKNSSSGTVTNGATFYAEGVRNTGGGTVTNGWGLFVADQTVASNNWAIQTGLGKVQFGDNVLASKSIGVGTSAPTSDALYIQPVANLSGTTQYGVRSIPQTSSAATAFGIGVYGRADTQSAAYTQTNNAAIYAATPTKGGGSAITNNYGLYIESIAGGVNNWAILALGAKSEFDGGIQVGATGTPILKYIEGTVVQDLASIPANTCSDTNAITVTGALDGDVAAGSALAAVASTAGLSITAYVSASDAAKVRVCNVTTGAIDPPSTTYRAGVWVH